MAVHQSHHQRRDILGQHMRIGRIVGHQHPGDAGDPRRRLGHRADAFAGDQRMHLAQLRGGGHRRQGRVLHRAVAMLDQNQHAHAATPNSLSLATSSSTEPTLIPACRFAGSSTLSVVRRAEMSTP